MRVCPRCGAAEIEFNERYRVDGETIPAWFCESPRCGYVQAVRARDSRTTRARRASSDLRAKAVRAVKRTHANTKRSKKLIKRAGRLSRKKNGS